MTNHRANRPRMHERKDATGAVYHCSVLLMPASDPLTLNYMLVPEEILMGHDSALRKQLTGSEFFHGLDPDDAFYGPVLRRAVLFAQLPYLLNDSLQLNEQTVLYNSYFWHSVLARVYTAKHGFNPAIEEATIAILGKTTIAVDWELIENLDELIEDKVAIWIECHS